MTEVAFPGAGVAVSSLIRGLVVAGPGPADQLLRNLALGILGPDELVQLIAVDIPGVGAGAWLDVMSDAGGSGKALAAERTRYVGATMGARVQMLSGIGPVVSDYYVSTAVRISACLMLLRLMKNRSQSWR